MVDSSPFLNSTAYVFERLCLRNLDVTVIYVPKKPPAVRTDVQVAARPTVLVQLDLSGAAYVHELLALAGRERRFERGPIRLAHGYRIAIDRTHTSTPTGPGGTPTCECLQPMQQTQAVIFLIAHSNCCGSSTTSPARE
jgi:hypothetical protein